MQAIVIHSKKHLMVITGRNKTKELLKKRHKTAMNIRGEKSKYAAYYC